MFASIRLWTASRPSWLRPRTVIRFRGVLYWGVLLFMSFNASGSGSTLKVGDVPPDVFGRSSTDQPIHLSDYRGRLVVISFWATWCVPCRKELPVLMNLEKKATREKVVVLSVNWQQSRQEFHEVMRIFREMGTDMTLISDASGRIGTAYGVKGIPHMLIVGKDGKIAAIHVGYNETEIPTLVDEINAAWSRTPSDAPNAN